MNKKITLFFLLIIIFLVHAEITTTSVVAIPGVDGEVLVVYEDGDPDRPLVVGRVYNDSDGDGLTDGEETLTGPSGEEIYPNETDFGFVNRATETETTGIEHKDIGITSTDPEAEEGKGSGDVIIKGSKIKENSKEDPEPFVPKKPREIVVVGSKVKDVERESSSNKSDLIERVETLASKPIENADDLELYAIALANSDDKIQKIVINEGVLVEYEQPAKFLGFIDVTYTASAAVDEFGRIKLQFPFWLFLTQNNATDIQTDLEERFGDGAHLAQMNLQDAMQKQQQTLQTISNVMKTHHETAMGIIRKIG